MPDHDYGKITMGEYCLEMNGHIVCKHCGERKEHFISCLVPLVLELKDKVERKDRALENVLTLLELEYDTVGHRAIKLVATEALKP